MASSSSAQESSTTSTASSGTAAVVRRGPRTRRHALEPLIAAALRSSADRRLLVSEIYDYVERHSDQCALESARAAEQSALGGKVKEPSWKINVRHILSVKQDLFPKTGQKEEEDEGQRRRRGQYHALNEAMFAEYIAAKSNKKSVMKTSRGNGQLSCSSNSGVNLNTARPVLHEMQSLNTAVDRQMSSLRTTDQITDEHHPGISYVSSCTRHVTYPQQQHHVTSMTSSFSAASYAGRQQLMLLPPLDVVNTQSTTSGSGSVMPAVEPGLGRQHYASSWMRSASYCGTVDQQRWTQSCVLGGDYSSSSSGWCSSNPAAAGAPFNGYNAASSHQPMTSWHRQPSPGSSTALSGYDWSASSMSLQAGGRHDSNLDVQSLSAAGASASNPQTATGRRSVFGYGGSGDCDPASSTPGVVGQCGMWSTDGVYVAQQSLQPTLRERQQQQWQRSGQFVDSAVQSCWPYTPFCAEYKHCSTPTVSSFQHNNNDSSSSSGSGSGWDGLQQTTAVCFPLQSQQPQQQDIATYSSDINDDQKPCLLFL